MSAAIVNFYDLGRDRFRRHPPTFDINILTNSRLSTRKCTFCVDIDIIDLALLGKEVPAPNPIRKSP